VSTCVCWLLSCFFPSHLDKKTQQKNTIKFMGLIRGTYEAKRDGFLPGGASLHLCMTPHGPDAATFEAASADGADGAPARLGDDGALAFMFETHLTPRVTPAAMGAPTIDRDYYKCWAGLRSHFTGGSGSAAAADKAAAAAKQACERAVVGAAAAAAVSNGKAVPEAEPALLAAAR
jgi:homogentisate 1,2-dioxygenase